MSQIRIGIVGATGYAGVELARLLTGHPDAAITYLSSQSQAGQKVGDVFPHLAPCLDVTLEAYDAGTAAAKCDVLFLARGNGWAMKNAAGLLEAGCKLIDMAADFRLQDTDCWTSFYKMEHEAKDLVPEAAYGIPELFRDQIRKARLVANAGCFATSAILALAPAMAGKWVETSGIVVSSASGATGAGRSRTEVAYLFTEQNENFRAYNVAKHRHTPEIEQALGTLAGEDVMVTFIPQIAPFNRGIHTTAVARLAEDAEPAALRNAYEAFYSSSPFVEVLPAGQLPETRQVTASNRCRIGLVIDERARQLVALSVIDNLGKGAAGQAIQSMNLMFGLDEAAGLQAPAVYP